MGAETPEGDEATECASRDSEYPVGVFVLLGRDGR